LAVDDEDHVLPSAEPDDPERDLDTPPAATATAQGTP
jgi:hypothetical protein